MRSKTWFSRVGIGLLAIASLTVTSCESRGNDFAHPHGELTTCIESIIDAKDKETVGSVAAIGVVYVSAGDVCSINTLTPVPVIEVWTNLWMRRYVGGVQVNVQCSSSVTHRGLNVEAVNASQSGGCGDVSWAYDADTEWYAQSDGRVYVYGNWYEADETWSPTERR